MIGIYAIVNLANNKKYIGSSINIERRIKRHRNELSKNKHINTYLQKSWNKYGEDLFMFVIIEECDMDILKIKEQQYLDEIFSINEYYKYYFNICNRSSGGDNLTNNPNRSIILNNIRNGLLKRYENMTNADWVNLSNSRSGDRNPNYGKKWSTEKRQRMSFQRKGQKSKIKGKTYEELHGIEKANFLKKSISERNKNQCMGENNPNYGKKCPDSIKKYYSENFNDFISPIIDYVF